MKTLLIMTAIFFSSFGFAQSADVAAPAAQANLSAKKITPETASYELLSPCLQFTELKAFYEMNHVSSASDESAIILTKYGYNYQQVDKKPRRIEGRAEMEIYDQMTLQKINAALPRFKINLKRKLAEVAEVPKTHRELLTHIKEGLCSCEKAGFDKTKIETAKKSVIEQKDIELALVEGSRDGTKVQLKRQLNESDLACP